MGLIDKIKGLFKEKEVSKDGTVIETIEFSKLYPKTENLLKEYSKKNEKLKKDISSTIKKFNSEINNSISNLQKVDLKKRKETEKMKAVVQQNLNLYIANLKRLLDNLDNTSNLDIDDQIKKIIRVFTEFDKSSHLPFHKATILVGKEMEDVKLVIKNFSKEFNSILDTNKDQFEHLEKVKDLKACLDSITQADEGIDEIKEKIEDIEESVETIKIEDKKSRENIDQIRTSELYKNDVLASEKYKIDSAYLDKNIEAIKQKINLKALSKHFHIDKKRSQLIDDYIKDFKSTIRSDENLEIISLVKEVNGAELLELKGIRNNVIQLETQTVFTSFGNITALENKIKDNEIKLSNVNKDIDTENKKIEKLNQKKTKSIFDAKKLVKTVFPRVQIKEEPAATQVKN